MVRATELLISSRRAPFPRSGLRLGQADRSPGFRITLLPAPSHPSFSRDSGLLRVSSAVTVAGQRRNRTGFPSLLFACRVLFSCHLLLSMPRAPTPTYLPRRLARQRLSYLPPARHHVKPNRAPTYKRRIVVLKSKRRRGPDHFTPRQFVEQELASCPDPTKAPGSPSNTATALCPASAWTLHNSRLPDGSTACMPTRGRNHR